MIADPKAPASPNAALSPFAPPEGQTWASVFATLGDRLGWTWDEVLDKPFDEIRAAWASLVDAGEG